MEEKFLSSGVFQFLDEVSSSRRPLFDYGFLVGRKELEFDEGLMNSKADLYNLLKSVGRGPKHTEGGLMDW